jgi:dTDP-4-amino-4,6-dideoxygalactose transaminase
MNHAELLAVNGGPKSVTNSISDWPLVNDAIRASITQALDTNVWGKYEGELTQRLQESLQSRFQCQHSMLTCSGTIAVELALRGVGVKSGDEVVMSAYDFPGNFRAVEMVGATPVIVDVCGNGWTIDIDGVAKAITEKTTAVLVSHLHGQLLDMKSLRSAIAGAAFGKKEIPVVEDCCQVPGAAVDDEACGSFGDVCVLSFGGSKLLSAGRGGAVLSNDESVVRRAAVHGARGNEAFPLSQLQAAVLLPQLEDLGKKNELREKGVEFLIDRISNLRSEKLFRPETQSNTAWYKLGWLLDDSLDREVVLARLQAEGVPVDVSFRGFTKRTARRCRKVGELKNAIRASNQTILMHHPALLEPVETLQQIADGFQKVLNSLDE